MISRGLLDHIDRYLIRPLKTRVANSIARAVVQVVDDRTKLQLLQIGVLAGEPIDDAERFQEFGFTSAPLPGSEAVVVFPNGDRSHALVVAVDDRRHRPTDLEPGESALYNAFGVLLKATKDGELIASSSSGATLKLTASGEVHITDAGGTTKVLVTKDEFDVHKHMTGVGLSAIPDNAPITGTTVLKAK